MNKSIYILVGLILSINLMGATISKTNCLKKDNFIFAGGECIEYRDFEGDNNDRLIIVVHGTWKEGTNILARYSPFAETLNLNTDITTVAIALPGYSNSSTNNFTALSHKGVKNLASQKEYIEFLAKVVKKLKQKYKAKSVIYVGHSAGAMMGASLSGLYPNLLDKLALAGGRYKLDKHQINNDLISIDSFINKLNKHTQYLLIYGTKDKISNPKYTKSFYKKAKKLGLNVKLVEVKDAVHLDLDMTDTSADAITNMLDN